MQGRSRRSCSKHAVRLRALNGDAGRGFHLSALSSNRPGSRPFKPRDAGATPARAAIFLKEAPALDPRLEFALPPRIRMKPAGGRSPAGAEFTWRSWRKSNVPVRQSGVGGASLPERTNWSRGVQQSAQRTFNPYGAGASPAGSTKLWVLDVQADGLVSKSDREGASPSGPANFFGV
jgi:hypothetical protein